MKNIFKNIDLSGIQKAIIQDNCFVEISRDIENLRIITIRKQENFSNFTIDRKRETFYPIIE